MPGASVGCGPSSGVGTRAGRKVRVVVAAGAEGECTHGSPGGRPLSSMGPQSAPEGVSRDPKRWGMAAQNFSIWCGVIEGTGNLCCA